VTRMKMRHAGMRSGSVEVAMAARFVTSGLLTSIVYF
jgi:hypothetical protein